MEPGLDLVAQLVPEPARKWEDEPALRPSVELPRQQVIGRLEQQRLRTPCLYPLGKAERPLNEHVVEQRHAHLQAVRHAHRVRIAEQNVLRVVLEIERGDLRVKVRLQVDAVRPREAVVRMRREEALDLVLQEEPA